MKYILPTSSILTKTDKMIPFDMTIKSSEMDETIEKSEELENQLEKLREMDGFKTNKYNMVKVKKNQNLTLWDYSCNEEFHFDSNSKTIVRELETALESALEKEGFEVNSRVKFKIRKTELKKDGTLSVEIVYEPRLTMEDLLSKYDEEKGLKGADYMIIAVSVNDSNPEYIINKRDNFETKIEYYKTAYDKNLKLKSNPDVRIV